MSDCHGFRDELDDVAAGEVAGNALQAHLQICASCSADLERKRALLARIEGVARALVAAEPTAAFAEPVLARVRAGVPLVSRRTGSGSPTWWLAGAAVAAAVVGFGVVEGIRHLPISAVPTASSASSVSQWHSPTSLLLQPTVSVLDVRSRGRLLDIGGNHAR